MAKSWTPPPSGFAPPPKGGEKYDLMTYADKLEQLADEWVPWDFPAIPLRSDQDYAASINLKLQGFNVADGSGAALARKVAALVRAASDLIGPVESGLNMGQVFLRNEQAREKLRNALADIEGDGE